jgi:hypothetical protein
MAELFNISDANALIKSGKWLHIAGEEASLTKLTKGNWIGGTIPYFLTKEGGMVDRERLFITELPREVTEASISFVSQDQLEAIPGRAPENGFSLVVIPGMSDAHAKYALAAERLPHIFEKPIVGWVAGVHLDDLGKVRPKVFNGQTGAASDDRIVVLQAHLPSSLIASIGIINVFEQGSGDTILFDDTGFSGDRCRINGQPASFYDYVVDQKLDMRFPLVANRSGEMINVSFQALDEAAHLVKFYAPVLEKIEYRQAKPIDDYRTRFIEATGDFNVSPAFTCNCILNYLHGKLEGKQEIPVSGPATFGEIAYILLNQTMVYLSLLKN